MGGNRKGPLFVRVWSALALSFLVGGGLRAAQANVPNPKDPEVAHPHPPSNGNGNNHHNNNGDADTCLKGEAWCSSLDEAEALALEAIRALHRQLDDDKNGNIDLAESDEFLREELKYEKNIENRQKAFHRNDDTQVSVRELWETWRKSEVHNWTVDQTVEWLVYSVGLPQHKEKFHSRSINGTLLPILAVNHNNFLQTYLGVKDSITRQRIAVKAMDVVLFGPPRDTTNRVKDAILTTLLAVALIACYLVYKRYQWAQHDLSKMSKHMAELSKAEETLMDLQRELEKARTDQVKKEAVVEGSNNIMTDEPGEITKLREENMILRSELHRAEVELQDKCWVPPPALQHWLQYTYELELKTYNKKKNAAEKQLKQAKEACEKLKKKRTSLMGAFVTTHGRSIDDVDKAILEARTALTEITHELQERMHRWKQVEMLIGCTIMNNPGMPYLESLLKVYGKPQSYGGGGPGSVISNSQDDIDDDAASSIYCPSAVSGPTSLQLSMARSKSASSMLNLRERGISRESSSKDSSNGEDDVSADPLDGSTRRVTFRADHRSRMKAFANGRTAGSLFDSMDNEEARRIVTIALSQTQSMESIGPKDGTLACNEIETPSEMTPKENDNQPPIITSVEAPSANHHSPLESDCDPTSPTVDENTSEPVPAETGKSSTASNGSINGHATPKNNPADNIAINNCNNNVVTPKQGKGKKLWHAFSKIVKGGENEPVKVTGNVSNGFHTPEGNGSTTATATSKKSSRRTNGLFSFFKYTDKTSDIRKLHVEA